MAVETDPGKSGDGKEENAAGDSAQLKATIDSQAAKIAELEKSSGEFKTRAEDSESALLQPDYLSFIDGKTKPKSQTTGKSFEDMEDGEKVQFIQGIVQEGIEAASKNVLSRLERVEGSVGMQSVESQVKDVIDGKADGEPHPDFWDFKADMKKDADMHPTLGALDLYERAKAKKLKLVKKSEEDALPETEKPGTSITSLQEKGLSKQEAIDTAYKRVMSKST